MKKPTLEEVKDYFKNAETVQCIFNKHSLSEIDINNIQLEYGEYWTKTKNTKINLWDKELGYAKILTYKKPEFRPIAMKCTQEEFDAVKQKLCKYGLEFYKMTSFEKDNYLVNNGFGIEKYIINFGFYFTKFNGREIYETWNEKVFLESCGIEVEEEQNFVITKEQLLILKNGYRTEKLIEWFPQAFKEDKKELSKDFTGWCKIDNEGDYLWTMYYEKGMLKYGIDSNGDWFIGKRNSIIGHSQREATEEEVFEALKNEAVRRGFIDGAYYRNLDNEVKEIEGLFYGWDGLHSKEGDGMIFKHGKWAEIHETITKAEAEKLLNKKII